MKTVLLMTTATVLYLFGCRIGSNQGELKDLNNYTRSENTALKMNQCRATPNQDEQKWLDTITADANATPTRVNSEYINITAKDEKSLQTLKSSLNRTLAAVPMNLQQAFFSTGGKISIDPRAQEICRGEYKKLKVHARAFAGEGQTPTSDLDVKALAPSGDAASDPSVVRKFKVAGCWVVVADKTDAKGNTISWHPEIVLSDEISKDSSGKDYAVNVEHSTVRLFGYLLSQILAHLDAKFNEDQRFDTSDIKVRVNDLFTARVAKLLDAVRADIKGKSSNDFFFYKKHLASLDNKGSQSDTEYTRLRMAMNHYTFAEAFDSYYCNNDTNLKMMNEFKKTYSLFFDKDEEGKQIGLAVELDYISVNEAKLPESGSLMLANPGLMFAGMGGFGYGSQSLAMELAYKRLAFLRIFGAIARGIGAIFRGVGRFVVGVFRGVTRLAAGIIRGVARLAVGLVRGVVWVAGAAVRGAAYVAGRVAGHVTSAFAPRFASRMAQFRGAGPFRAGFTDATRVWYPTYRRR